MNASDLCETQGGSLAFLAQEVANLLEKWQQIDRPLP